jgi:hypothetical protein
VALGVARGWSDKEIAQALRRRPTSIRTHLRWLLHRLGLPDRVALRQWVRSGCLDDPYIAPLLDLEDPPGSGRIASRRGSSKNEEGQAALSSKNEEACRGRRG